MSIKSVGNLVAKLQSTVAVCCTVVFSTTSGAAFDAVLHLPSLCTFVRGAALKATCRFKRNLCYDTEWGEAVFSGSKDLETNVFLMYFQEY